MGRTIEVEQRDGVTWITLNRPDRLNAMNVELIDEVLDALEVAEKDDDVRVVVMTGAGRGFCAGGDLGGVADVDREQSLDEKVADLRRHTRSSELLHGMDKITIAAVNGPCAGAGLSWACAADLRIAGESAIFKTSFLSAGMSGDFGGTWSLAQIVGPARARELYFLNRKLTASDAAAIGLVSEVVPDDQLLARVDEVARGLAASAPLALREMKRNLNDAQTTDLSGALDAEAERHIRTAYSADCAEAAAAFLEKRQPVFGGR
jgi:2-(1,2-epoxy-1,2-dihydrophenyl)acetyl-CoA isomerase